MLVSVGKVLNTTETLHFLCLKMSKIFLLIVYLKYHFKTALLKFVQSDELSSRNKCP